MNIVSLILVIALNCLFLCEAYIEWPWSSHWMLCFSVKHTLSVLFISSSCFCMAARCCLQVHIFYFWSYHVQSDRLDLFRHTLGELFLSVQWKKARWSDCCHCQWISNSLLWIMLLISMCRLIVKCPCHHFQSIFFGLFPYDAHTMWMKCMTIFSCRYSFMQVQRLVLHNVGWESKALSFFLLA